MDEQWLQFWHGRGVVGAHPHPQLQQDQQPLVHYGGHPLESQWQQQQAAAEEPRGRSWFQRAEEAASVGLAWVALGSAVVGLVFKLLVLVAAAWGL